MTTSRREFLWNIGGGLGGLAVSQMLAHEAFADDRSLTRPEFNGGRPEIRGEQLNSYNFCDSLPL